MRGLPSWAVKGARVVCVDDWCQWRRRKWDQITKGEIYVVGGAANDDDFGVYVEIVGTQGADGSIGRWHPDRFRPLITQEDDIATHFRQHLGVREPVEA